MNRLWRWLMRSGHHSEESEVALRQAERALLDARCRDDAARDVAERLRQTRIRNHFAEAVERSMRRT